jgi:hypothetical protein
VVVVVLLLSEVAFISGEDKNLGSATFQVKLYRGYGLLFYCLSRINKFDSSKT